MHHNSPVVAYALSKKYWGRGYTTEAVRAVIAFGYNTMELNRIEARCDPLNVASAGVLEKVGMKMYSILRAEWAAAAGRT